MQMMFMTSFSKHLAIGCWSFKQPGLDFLGMGMMVNLLKQFGTVKLAWESEVVELAVTPVVILSN